MRQLDEKATLQPMRQTKGTNKATHQGVPHQQVKRTTQPTNTAWRPGGLMSPCALCETEARNPNLSKHPAQVPLCGLCAAKEAFLIHCQYDKPSGTILQWGSKVLGVN